MTELLIIGGCLLLAAFTRFILIQLSRDGRHRCHVCGRSMRIASRRGGTVVYRCVVRKHYSTKITGKR